jgi:hypothetical protein
MKARCGEVSCQECNQSQAQVALVKNVNGLGLELLREGLGVVQLARWFLSARHPLYDACLFFSDQWPLIRFDAVLSFCVALSARDECHGLETDPTRFMRFVGDETK